MFEDFAADPIQLAWMVNQLVRLIGIAPSGQDPIRLVRMVNQFHRCSGKNFRTIQASWMGLLKDVAGRD
jgi:hypothetical protein